MEEISVVIITLNEEKYIENCIKSVKNFASEVVVVDSGSKDRTKEIAESLGAKVVFHKFVNFCDQKNYAKDLALGDWILSLDADEIIPEKLGSEIKSAVKQNEISAFSMPRENIIFGKFIRHTRWQPEFDRHVWLWKKGSAEWVGKVHEDLVVKGKVGKLKNSKVHYQYETISEFLDMMNRYSEIEATEKIEAGTKFSYLKAIFEPIYNFLVRYFYRLGFLDGWRGFFLSYLMAIYHLELWVKIWEKSPKTKA